MSLGLFHQFVCLPHKFPRHTLKFSGDYRPFIFQKLPGLFLSFDSAKTRTEFRLNAASVSGSGAEYSEQWLGTKQKEKRQSIAGIDQDELLDPTLLADPDSCFCEFKGVQIHHKICHEEETNQSLSQLSYQALGTKKIGLPMILLHGFGASVFSWERVMKSLAQITGSKVLAFDRPAFGLTSRVLSFEHSTPGRSDTTKALNPFSMAFSVLVTLHFINFLAAEKAILIGHSAGALVAVDTYFKAPERVAALILVAPAILAPCISPKGVKENQMGRENQIQDGGSNSNVQENLFFRIGKTLSKFCVYTVQAIMRIIKGMVGMVNSLYKNTVTAILRSAFAVTLVRMIMDKFGIAALRNAWYDANQITDHVVRGYTKPLRVKGWDRALVEYTLAMLTDSASESKPPLSKRLNEILCPVLIITGDSDRLVPSWNAERLSQAVSGSCFQVIRNCGHLPQEERVEEFVSVIKKFLQTVLGAPDEQLLQTTA